MGKKGRKTRWRKLPIPIGNGHNSCGGEDEEEVERDDIKPHHNHHHHHHHHNQQQQQQQQHHQNQNHHQSNNNVPKTTFNEDEYTKITTPRQDMLFKKGYLGKKKTVPVTPPQDSVETQSADSVESDQYICEEQIQPQYIYPGPGYMDQNGLIYINNSYEVYDPYTGNVTMIVGPAYHAGPHPGVLTAVPCQPVPLQPLEWFNPSLPQPHPGYSIPMYSSRKKRNSIDSQNYSGQSSETTGPPGSPQEPIEGSEPPVYPQQYVYPGYMFGAPLYNMNGVTVQGVVPQSAPLSPPADQAKRRKKRRRRRRGGVTDEGSESSCEDMLSCDASGVTESHSGASSDTAPGSSSSKTNSDSGIHTDPTALTSGANSPRLPIDEPYFHSVTNENEEISYEQQVEVVEKEVLVEGMDDEGIQSNILNVTQPVTSVSLIQTSEEKSFSPKIENVDCDNSEPSNSDTDFVPQELNVSNNESIINVTNNHNMNSEVMIEETSVIVENIKEEINVSETENDPVLNKEHIVEEMATTLHEVTNEEIVKIDESNVDVTEVTSRLAEQTIHEVTCDRPITEAVTKWLRSQGGSAIKLSNSSSSTTESEDEGIEEGEDALVPALSTTGQKNGQGNPFPVSSPSSSDNGTRVATHDYSFMEEEQDWTSLKIGQMCDAKRSVHKYYSLGSATIHTDSPVPPAVVLKTAMHLGHTGPFPCGICCILQ